MTIVAIDTLLLSLSTYSAKPILRKPQAYLTSLKDSLQITSFPLEPASRWMMGKSLIASRNLP
jgi:hypothetical protein